MKTPTYSQLAHRLETDDAPGWAVHSRALSLQRSGEDVVVLSIGDPDFRTPEPIVDNAISHLRVGRTHYSPALGELNLRRAVADYESRVSPHNCSIDEVAIFAGVTSAIHSVLACLLDAGDEIVLVDPQYVGYEPIIRALDVVPVVVDAPAHQGFVPTYDSLVAAVTDKTQVMFLNTPANPTGSIIGLDVLKQLAAFCQQRGIWLVCDEVYSMFTYERPHTSLRTAAEKLDNLVVIDGLSKSHAMSGWRMGWAVAPKALIEHLGRYATMSMFGCPQFIQDASAFALNNDEYYVRDMCDIYRKRRDVVCDLVNASASLSCIVPEAGMFVMVDVSRVNADDVLFAESLLTEKRVSVLPGSAFGNTTRGHVRVSLVQPVEQLQTGCQRLTEFTS